MYSSTARPAKKLLKIAHFGQLTKIACLDMLNKTNVTNTIGEGAMNSTMNTEREFGGLYAEFSNAVEIVDINEMVSGSVDIPDEDYNTMVDAGIVNPDAWEYWAGYNNYVRGL